MPTNYLSGSISLRGPCGINADWLKYDLYVNSWANQTTICEPCFIPFRLGLHEFLLRSLMRVLLYGYHYSLLHSRVGSQEPFLSISKLKSRYEKRWVLHRLTKRFGDRAKSRQKHASCGQLLLEKNHKTKP